MPEKNEEMSLRDALINAMSADPAGEQTPATEETSEVPETGNAPSETTEEQPGEQVETTGAGELATTAPEMAPTAPPAAQNTPSMAEMWQAFQSLVAENQQLKSAMNQQSAAMQQQSQAAEGAIMNQFSPAAAVPSQPTTENTAPPSLNFAEISYLDPQQQQEHIARWQQEMMDYAVRTAAAQLRAEFAPVREDYETNRRIAADEAARTTLFSMPQFADLKGKEGDIEKVIASTPLLGSAEPGQKYMLAALISRGMNSSKGPSTEELIEMAASNPDVMKALETRRVAEIQKNNESLPKVVPSSGISNANAVPESKPKTMDDIRERMYKALGIR